ncbi:MAG TPA: cyanophycin synthetase [Flavobacteriaceae bacterium]|nr:cyanophycin synthetase [Flavobacteriaceae bacterium]
MQREYSKYYFVGVGGIGMSALARYVLMQGKEVHGYDSVETELTVKLQEEGVHVTYSDIVEELPELNLVDTLVVYTPAVSNRSRLLNHFQRKGFLCVKRAIFLGHITKSTVCLAVAGSHGKTTTASILAHLLIDSGKSVSAFLGGIAENYQSNFIYRGSEMTVVEADEYDRSFLHLLPNIACINNTDADHLDIYESPKALQKAFEDFAALVQNRNDLVHPSELDFGGTTVAVASEADYSAQNIKIQSGYYLFDLHTPNGVISDFKFMMPGKHNLMNAVTALTMALKAGVSDSLLLHALPRFEGVDRRFSIRYKSDDRVIIEDYAHHPTELRALYNAAKTMYKTEEIALVFQPHLYSRTRDFGKEFAESLSLFDELILLEIYPAREESIEGVSSQWILDQVTISDKKLVSKEELINEVKSSSAKVVLMAGAGDITKEVQNLVKWMEYEK